MVRFTTASWTPWQYGETRPRIKTAVRERFRYQLHSPHDSQT